LIQHEPGKNKRGWLFLMINKRNICGGQLNIAVTLFNSLVNYIGSMKLSSISAFIFLVTLFACRQPGNNLLLQQKVDSLQQQLSAAYKPGLGEFMSGIQVHHAKLWFAGKNQNWKLASFEIKEIEEALAGIQQYCTDRPETKSIGMMDGAIDSINKAIEQKNSTQFNNGYLLLTTSCNSCHRATAHEFNVITIPANPPFTNQDFKAP
jgi:hypothetical protein